MQANRSTKRGNLPESPGGMYLCAYVLTPTNATAHRVSSFTDMSSAPPDLQRASGGRLCTM